MECERKREVKELTGILDLAIERSIDLLQWGRLGGTALGRRSMYGFDHAILKMPIRKSRDVEEAVTHLQFKEEMLETYI